MSVAGREGIALLSDDDNEWAWLEDLFRMDQVPGIFRTDVVNGLISTADVNGNAFLLGEKPTVTTQVDDQEVRVVENAERLNESFDREIEDDACSVGDVYWESKGSGKVVTKEPRLFVVDPENQCGVELLSRRQLSYQMEKARTGHEVYESNGETTYGKSFSLLAKTSDGRTLGDEIREEMESLPLIARLMMSRVNPPKKCVKTKHPEVPVSHWTYRTFME